MSIPGSASPLFFTAAADAAAAGPIKSVRFNRADSAYLNKSFSTTGNQKTFTISLWIKKCLNTTSQYLFTTEHTGGDYFEFTSNADQIQVYNNASTSVNVKLERNLRDPSAWYHLVLAVDTTQATQSDRLKIYVNGEHQTDYADSTFPAQNYTFDLPSSRDRQIGAANFSGSLQGYFDGYMADFYFIDGAAKDVTDFGAFDDNGVWQAAAYSGTFGTNGFHLFDFANESGIGNDSSGNDNDWTVNNLSTTAGTGNDVLFDVPTNGDSSDDTGAGGEVSGNYCVMNPLHHLHAATLVNGSLQTTSSEKAFSTFLLKTGKWYVEHKIDSTGYNLCFSQIDHPSGATPSSSNSKSIGWYIPNGYVYWGAGYSASLGGTTMTGLDSSGYMSNASVGDIIAAAIDMDNSTIKFYKNGSEVGSIDFSTGNAHRFAEGMYISQFNGYGHWNFGQRAYSYAAPSGYKALCTTNLPTPTIADGSTAFDTVTYASDGTSRIISGLNMSPDLVWSKRRSDSARHVMSDSVRGVNKELFPNLTHVERTSTNGLTAFNSDGYTLGNDSGQYGWQANNHTFVNWAWDAGSSTVSNTDGTLTAQLRANPTAGFSIATVTYGSNTNETYGHGLNAAPEFVFAKSLETASSWYCYHKSLGKDKYIVLNDTGAQSSLANSWGTSNPTSSVMGLRSGTSFYDGDSSVIYAFTSVSGFSAFGSYTGNGSADGPFVYTGFRPALVIIKIYSGTTSNWVMLDSTRDPDNVVQNNLYADTSDAENQFDWADFLSNGFKPRVSYSQVNGSGYDYLYMAWAENPFSSNGGLAR